MVSSCIFIKFEPCCEMYIVIWFWKRRILSWISFCFELGFVVFGWVDFWVNGELCLKLLRASFHWHCKLEMDHIRSLKLLWSKKILIRDLCGMVTVQIQSCFTEVLYLTGIGMLTKCGLCYVIYWGVFRIESCSTVLCFWLWYIWYCGFFIISYYFFLLCFICFSFCYKDAFDEGHSNGKCNNLSKRYKVENSRVWK